MKMRPAEAVTQLRVTLRLCPRRSVMFEAFPVFSLIWIHVNTMNSWALWSVTLSETSTGPKVKTQMSSEGLFRLFRILKVNLSEMRSSWWASWTRGILPGPLDSGGVLWSLSCFRFRGGASISLFSLMKSNRTFKDFSEVNFRNKSTPQTSSYLERHGDRASSDMSPPWI